MNLDWIKQNELLVRIGHRVGGLLALGIAALFALWLVNAFSSRVVEPLMTEVALIVNTPIGFPPRSVPMLGVNCPAMAKRLVSKPPPSVGIPWMLKVQVG